MTRETKIHVFPSPEGVIEHAAKTLRDASRAEEDRRFHLALSGGSTPEALYRRLAEAHAKEVPWDRLEVFFGDERAVPPDHADSNYRLALTTLLSRVPLPAEQVHRMPADEPDLRAAALRYEEEIRKTVPPSPAGEPVFDLIWLGLGEDGHTASLFPGSPALADTEDLVAPNEIPGLPARRMTFTLPLINNARRIQFLVVGKRKARVVARVLGPPADQSPIVPLPAARVRPLYGDLEWLLDREAAELIADTGLLA